MQVAQAATLRSVEVLDESGVTRVRLVADAPLRSVTQWLPATGRVMLAVDLPGVVRSTKARVPAPMGPLLHVGLSQWQKTPPITRLVLHLPERRPFAVEEGVNEVSLVFGRGAADTPVPAAPAIAGLKGEDGPAWRRRRISLSFRDAEIGDVLRIVSEQNRMNIVIHPEVKGLLSVHLDDVPIEDALKALLGVHGYGYSSQGDILIVLPGRNFRPHYRIYPLKTASGAALFSTLKDIVPPPGHLLYESVSNSLVLYAPGPGIREIVENALDKLDRATDSPAEPASVAPQDGAAPR